MKSNKQRRAEIKEKRLMRAQRKIYVPRFRNLIVSAGDRESVDVAALRPNNSYGEPDFVRRGFYLPSSFSCSDCGAREIWTAKQQKLWYENWQGTLFSSAVRCRVCRARARATKAEARAASFAAIIKKLKKKNENANRT